MKRQIVFLIMYSLSIILYGQKDSSEVWIKMIENPKYSINALKKANLKDKYINYDFSVLYFPKIEFIGFINDYTRIQIYFTSIQKDTFINDQYLLKGISVTGNNVCNFKGKIKIQQIREFVNLHLGTDSECMTMSIKSQGLLMCNYEFSEDQNQKNSGVFKGFMTVNFFIDSNGILHRDYIQSYSDNFRNNQYIGHWKSYKGDSFLICNWGEFRIPFSGDLDIGVGVFSVNPKYKIKGWEIYNPRCQ